MSEEATRLVQQGREEPLHPHPPTPVEPIAGRKASNLALRLLTAAILVPPVIYVIVLGGIFVPLVVITFILLGLREFYQLIEAKGAHPLHTFGYVAAAALPIVAFLGNEYHATVLMTAVLLGAMVLQLTKARISESLASISGTFFGVFYVGWLLSHAVVLREFHAVAAGKWGEAAVAQIHPNTGIFLMLFTIATVVWADAGAYFAGRAWGKRKLAPTISPGKTVEGALGGVAGGTLSGLACKGIFDVFWPELSAIFGWTLAAALALIAAVMAILGDLVESLIKRDAQLKDTGRLLPGTGGVLDRIDSNLLAIPVMYYLLLALTYLRAG